MPALVYFPVVCRYKGDESGTEKMLFGRMIIVIKKMRERWWKSVSPPSWWGGSRCCYPVETSCPGAVLIGWLFLWRETDSMGARAGVLKIDLLEKDADVDGDDER